MVQWSHLYMTTGKTIALTIWTFVRKVISLIFNALSRFVIVFLPRSKCLNFMAAVALCLQAFYCLCSFHLKIIPEIDHNIAYSLEETALASLFTFSSIINFVLSMTAFPSALFFNLINKTFS